MPSVEDFIVDFSQEAESAGGQPHYKPGKYHVRIVAAKTGVSEDKGTPYLEVTFAFLDGRYRKAKKKISERLYNSPKAMRRYRILLQAVGLKVPGKLNLTKLIPKLKGKDLWIDLEDDEREGYSVRSRVGFEGFISDEDYDPSDEADDEDIEDEDEDDIEDEDEDAEEEEDEDDDLEDEDEEEEEPAPKKRAKAAKSKPKAKSSRKRKPAADEDEDEDEDLEELDLDAM